MKEQTPEDVIKLAELCNLVRNLIQQNNFTSSEKLIVDAMGKFPHAPQPHNLIGLLLEKKGNHIAAMKHFRAAWALDPTYIPARCNLDSFASFYQTRRYAFDESDCPMYDNLHDEFIYNNNDTSCVTRRK